MISSKSLESEERRCETNQGMQYRVKPHHCALSKLRLGIACNCGIGMHNGAFGLDGKHDAWTFGWEMVGVPSGRAVWEGRVGWRL